MPSYVKDLLLFAAMIGAGILLNWQWTGLADRMDRLATSQKEFATGAQEAINTPDKDGYLGRIQSFLEIYKKTVAENQEGRVEWSGEMKEKLGRQLENGAITEEQYNEKIENLALVKAAYDTLLSARWESQLTHAGKADTRLDIHRIRPQTDSDGKTTLEADFFLWGIEPDTQVIWGRMESQFWQGSEGSDSEPLVVVTRNNTLLRPTSFVQNPTKVVHHFPPYVAIGTFQFPEPPPSATLMDLKLEYTVRKGDTEVPTHLNWNKVPVSTRWRTDDDSKNAAN